MEHGEGIVRGAAGLKLYYQRWRPEAQPPRAIVAFIRSLHSHTGLYPSLVARLVPHGYAVYGFTHREHDRSPGQQGYIEEWGESREDVRAFLHVVAQEEPGVPLFLMGNGLGGLMAQAYALHYPEGLTGVVAFDPAVQQEGASPFHRRLVRVLSRLWLQFTTPVQLDARTIAPEPAHPGDERAPTARPDGDDSGAIEQSGAEPGDVSVPLLILHGAADQERSQTFTGSGEYGQALGELEVWMEQRL